MFVKTTLLILIIVIIGTIMWTNYKNGTGTISTPNWKTFTNAIYTIKYPPNWTIIKGCPAVEFVPIDSLPNNSGCGGTVKAVAITFSPDVPDVLDMAVRRPAGHPITFDGIPATESDNYRSIWFTYKGNEYTLYVTDDSKQYIDTFKLMEKTFKLFK